MFRLAAEGARMDDQLPPVPGGVPGLLGVLGVAGSAAFWWLKRLLRKDSIDAQGDGATKDIIVMLREQVQNERTRADQERDRADKLSSVLEAANQQITQLRTQVETLSGQVSKLQDQVVQLTNSTRSTS